MGVFCCVSYNKTERLVATAKSMRRWMGKAGGGPFGRSAYERGDHRVTKAASPQGRTQAGLQGNDPYRVSGSREYSGYRCGQMGT